MGKCEGKKGGDGAMVLCVVGSLKGLLSCIEFEPCGRHICWPSSEPRHVAAPHRHFVAKLLPTHIQINSLISKAGCWSRELHKTQGN